MPFQSYVNYEGPFQNRATLCGGNELLRVFERHGLDASTLLRKLKNCPRLPSSIKRQQPKVFSSDARSFHLASPPAMRPDRLLPDKKRDLGEVQRRLPDAAASR